MNDFVYPHLCNPDMSDITDAEARQVASWGIDLDAYIAAHNVAFNNYGQPVFIVDRSLRPLAVVWEESDKDTLHRKQLRTGWPLFTGDAVYADTGESATLVTRDAYAPGSLEEVGEILVEAGVASVFGRISNRLTAVPELVQQAGRVKA